MQERALRVVYPGHSYAEALAKSGLQTLVDRRRAELSKQHGDEQETVLMPSSCVESDDSLRDTRDGEDNTQPPVTTASSPLPPPPEPGEPRVGRYSSPELTVH